MTPQLAIPTESPGAAPPISASDTAYGPEGEARLRAEVERLTGGVVVSMERQLRWRPAWFAKVARGGATLAVYIRGDRESDVMPFPDLQREADIMTMLREHGVPVPCIYGLAEAPQAIVMEALPGVRDMATARDDVERRAILGEYVKALAAMHRAPLDAFVAKGLSLPVGERDIALAGVNAYLPLYRRKKRRPEPLIEFALRWLDRNIPKRRTRACLVQFDAGQFHFEDGRLTGLYDFEFAMLADPLADFASMRTREPVEPMGGDMRWLYRLYEAETGEPVDRSALSFHTLVFATVATMQFSSTIGDPQPGAPHAVYLEFDLALRQVLLTALSECLGLELANAEPSTSAGGDNMALIEMVADAVAGLQPVGEAQAARQRTTVDLIEYLARAEACGSGLRSAALADINALLGSAHVRLEAAEVALERFVLDADPEQDAALFTLLARDGARRLDAFGSTRIGGSAAKVFLPPIH